ncbi:MAG: DNA repair protein RadA [Candidatus Pacebacteria bacterium]|nr:DNA repair protein RadA [Candidatus Paceibacterota bacterium]
MTAKTLTQFICQNCGASYSKWQGQCAQCQEWNTLVEELVNQKSDQRQKTSLSKALLNKKLLNFSQVERLSEAKQRFLSNIGELDRVLGGGLVTGMTILIGGEPGIGKSTLLTQTVLMMVAKSAKPLNIFYVCGEESPSQIGMRIERLLKKSKSQNLREKLNKALFFVTSSDVDEITTLMAKQKPDLVIVDSIQSVTTSDLTGASGSVGQIRECSARFIDQAKSQGVPVFLVGHITKDGAIAGPKILEHMVDTVLIMEGERSGQLRILRSLKNRFGASDEVGIFQAVDWGLNEVTNPSELFLENQNQAVSGAATVCVMEGSRPLLTEVQALVVSSHLAMPRRVGRGIDVSRIQVLAAVLQKHARLSLSNYDVFVSAAGGFKLSEPAVDLGLAVAIASSMSGKKIPQKTVFIGEIGLLGEVRQVAYFERRVKEAKRLGFNKIISAQNYKHISQVIKAL